MITNLELPQFSPEHLTYEEGLFLTLYREESVSLRIAQLKAVYPYLNAICYADKVKENALWYGLIQLHDYKGQLHVLWKNQAAFELLFKYVDNIWFLLKECNVKHFVGNQGNLVKETDCEVLK